MSEDSNLTAKVLDAFDQTEFTPYSAWCQYFFSHGGSETQEGLAFCAPRSEAQNVEQFIAASIFRVLNFFHYSKIEVRTVIETAIIHSTARPLEQCSAFGGLANTSIRGSSEMLTCFLNGYPNLKPLYEIFELTGSIDAFAVAENERNFVALYWYTTA